MKKIVLLMLSLLLSIGLWSQTVPQGIPFQGVARDMAGQSIGEKELDVRIRLQNNNGSAQGLLYEEYHQIQTNHLGLFQLVVGQGRSSATDFSTIPWSKEEIWLEISIRESDNGGDYEVLSHSQLLSVPYAMHAGSADRVGVADADSFAVPYWKTNGNSGSLPQFQFIGTVDAKDLNFRTSNQNRLKIQSGGDIEIQMSLDVAQDLVVNGQSTIGGDLYVNGVLYGDGSGLTNIDVNDGDADPTNELQTWSNLPGIPEHIDTDSRDDFSGDYADLMNAPQIPTKTSDLTNDSGYVTTSNDADADPTNEIELPTTGNVGDMAYWNGTTWVSIPSGTVGQVLTIGAGGVPAWSNASGGTPPVPNVTNPSTGEIWMDRNLGATQVATSSTDAAAYGDLYQWGRAADGHQSRTSATTCTLSTSDTPGHGDFITTNSSPYDWRSPKNDNLWQGVSGINNPCPSGYRLPTAAEWEAERTSWTSNNAAGAYNSPLRLPVAGNRNSSGGALSNVGSSGSYWSSTLDGPDSRHLLFNSSVALMYSNGRAYGFSVRCLKD